MGKKWKKLFLLACFCFCLLTVLLPSKSTYASQDSTKVVGRSIMTTEQTVRTPSSDVAIVAWVTVSESQHKIIQVKSARVFSYSDGIDGSTISLSSPSIWNNGQFATITVTYNQKGIIKSEVCTFYPL